VWRDHADADALMHDADTAIYAAKTAGKSRVAVRA
jgi:PleD family two-component response regulator